MKVDTISTIAIAAGSFLLGGSLGLALNGCSKCSPSEMACIFGKKVMDEMANNIEENKEWADSIKTVNKDIFDDEVIEEYKSTSSIYITESLDNDDNDEDVNIPITYVISRDSYENEYLDYHKESLVYFENDGVLVDDKDEIVDNVESMVSLKALRCFGEMSGDEDIVYVRNMRIRCDFEIVREHMSYKENVLGITEEDSEEYLEARKFFNLDTEKQEE